MGEHNVREVKQAFALRAHPGAAQRSRMGPGLRDDGEALPFSLPISLHHGYHARHVNLHELYLGEKPPCLR